MSQVDKTREMFETVACLRSVLPAYHKPKRRDEPRRYSRPSQKVPPASVSHQECSFPIRNADVSIQKTKCGTSQLSVYKCEIDGEKVGLTDSIEEQTRNKTQFLIFELCRKRLHYPPSIEIYSSLYFLQRRALLLSILSLTSSTQNNLSFRA